MNVLEIYGIVYSVKDPAGSGMAEYIIKYYRLEKSNVCKNAITCYVGNNFVLAGFSEDVIYFDFLDGRLPDKVSRYIVLSRHSSAKKVCSYTVHHTGNFGPEAPYGGRPRTLSIANPIVSHKLLINLNILAEEYGRIDEYEVSYEATHHGPTDVRKPLNFVEIGSTIDEWKDPVNHEIVALAVIKFLENPNHECIPVTGVGGGHYPRKHTKMAFEKNYCYGHIMAKYALQYLSPEILEEMIVKSDPVPQRIIVEKKGTRREHRRIIEQYVLNRGIVLEYI